MSNNSVMIVAFGLTVIATVFAFKAEGKARNVRARDIFSSMNPREAGEAFTASVLIWIVFCFLVYFLSHMRM